MAKARVTYTWSNGDAVIQHHEWDDDFDREGIHSAGLDLDNDPVYGYIEAAYQADLSPVREMDNHPGAGELRSVKVERFDG